MMEVQKHTAEMTAKWGLSNDAMARYADLVSEIGELGKELVVGTNYGKSPLTSNKSLNMEMGDVIFSLALFANALGLDMEKCFAMTIEKCHRRMAEKGHIGS